MPNPVSRPSKVLCRAAAGEMLRFTNNTGGELSPTGPFRPPLPPPAFARLGDAAVVAGTASTSGLPSASFFCIVRLPATEGAAEPSVPPSSRPIPRFLPSRFWVMAIWSGILCSGVNMKLSRNATATAMPDHAKARRLGSPCREISRHRGLSVSAARLAAGFARSCSRASPWESLAASIRRSAASSTCRLRSSPSFRGGRFCRVVPKAKFLQQLPGLGTGGQHLLNAKLLVGGQFAVEIRAEPFCVGNFVHVRNGLSSGGRWWTKVLYNRSEHFWTSCLNAAARPARVRLILCASSFTVVSLLRRGRMARSSHTVTVDV